MIELRYKPTRERCTLVGIANEGQAKPGDPGHGERLYAVRRITIGRGATRTDTWQATAGELSMRIGDGWIPFDYQMVRRHELLERFDKLEWHVDAQDPLHHLLRDLVELLRGEER